MGLPTRFLVAFNCGPVVVFTSVNLIDGIALTLSILLLIAPRLGSLERAILQPVSVKRSSTTHCSLISWPTYRECTLIGLTNGLNAGCASILIGTNSRNISLDLHPLHRLRGSRIRDNTTLCPIDSVLDSVGCHIISWKNHDRGTRVLAGVFHYRKSR